MFTNWMAREFIGFASIREGATYLSVASWFADSLFLLPCVMYVFLQRFCNSATTLCFPCAFFIWHCILQRTIRIQIRHPNCIRDATMIAGGEIFSPVLGTHLHKIWLPPRLACAQHLRRSHIRYIRGRTRPFSLRAQFLRTWLSGPLALQILGKDIVEKRSCFNLRIDCTCDLRKNIVRKQSFLLRRKIVGFPPQTFKNGSGKQKLYKILKEIFRAAKLFRALCAQFTQE